MALPVNGSTHLIPAYYSFYRPRKDERLSWPSWLTFSGCLTYISGHQSAAGRAQDRESSPARDRRSTTVPCHQPPSRGHEKPLISYWPHPGQIPGKSSLHAGSLASDSDCLSWIHELSLVYIALPVHQGGSVAEWLACWTQVQKGPGSNRSRDAVG